MGHAHSSHNYAHEGGQGEWNQTYPRPYKTEYYEGPSSLNFEPRIAPGLTGHHAAQHQQHRYASRTWEEEDDFSDVIRYPPARYTKGGPPSEVPKVKVLPEHLPAGPRLRPTNNGNLLQNGGTISGRRSMLDGSDEIKDESRLSRRESQLNRSSSSHSAVRQPHSHGESAAQSLSGFSPLARHSSTQQSQHRQRDQHYESERELSDSRYQPGSESEDVRESSRSASPPPAPYTIIEESPAKSRIKARKRIKAPPPPAHEDAPQPVSKSKNGMYQRRDSDRPVSSAGFNLSEPESSKESRKIRLFKTKSDVKAKGEHWHNQALREKASSTSNLVTSLSNEMRHRRESGDRITTLPGPITVFSSATVKVPNEWDDQDDPVEVSLHRKPTLIVNPDPKFQREIRDAVQRKESFLNRSPQTIENSQTPLEKRAIPARQTSFVFHERNVRPSEFKRKESLKITPDSPSVQPLDSPKQFYFGMPVGVAEPVQEPPLAPVVPPTRITPVDSKDDDVTQEEIDRILQDFDRVATGNMSTLKSSKIKSTRLSPPPPRLPPSPQSSSKRPHRSNSVLKPPPSETTGADDDSSHEEISLSLRPTLPKKLLDLPKFSPSAAWRALGAVTAKLPRVSHEEADLKSPNQSNTFQYSLTDSEKRVPSLATTTQSRSDSSAEMNDVFEDRISRRVRPAAPARPNERSADSGISADDANSPAPLPDLAPSGASPLRRSDQPLAMSSPVPNHWVPEHDLNSDSSPNPLDRNETLEESIAERSGSIDPHLSGRVTPPKFTRKMFPLEESVSTEKIKNSPQTYNSLRKLKRSVSGITAAIRARSKSPDLSDSGGEKETTNWLLSRSAPNSVLNGSDSQLLVSSSKNSNSNRSKQRIMYLPEYDSRRIVTAYDMQRSRSADPLLEPSMENGLTQSLDRVNDSVRNMGPAQRAARKKGKKFTFQSTIRQQERRIVEAKLTKEAEMSEKQRLREMESMRQVEEQFQKKRAKEKATIRQQLRLLNLESSSRGENPVRMRSDGEEEEEESPTWPTPPADWDDSAQESSPSQPWDSSFSAPQSPSAQAEWKSSKDSKYWSPNPDQNRGTPPYAVNGGDYRARDSPTPDLPSGSPQIVKERSFLGLKWRRSKSALSSADSTLSRTRQDPEGAPAPRKEVEMRREIIASSRVRNGNVDYPQTAPIPSAERESQFERKNTVTQSQKGEVMPARYLKYPDDDYMRSKPREKEGKLDYSTSSAELSDSYTPRRRSDSSTNQHRPTPLTNEAARFHRNLSASSVELSERYHIPRKAESSTSSLSKTDKKSSRDSPSRNGCLTQELSEYRTEHRQYRDYRSPRQYVDPNPRPQRRGSESGGESSLYREGRSSSNCRSNTPSGASASRYSDNYRWDFAHGLGANAANGGRTSALSPRPVVNYAPYKSRPRPSGSVSGHTDSDSDFLARSRPIRH